MPQPDARTLPLDAESLAALERRGFEYRLVDSADPTSARAYTEAESRGFLGGENTEEEIAEFREAIGYRRWTGVFDAPASAGATPVATINSWVGEMSVPGARTVPFWAISGVTVSGTRRRKGIARAMLEGELRTAAAAGVPVAGLTVSEATIYGRYGFAPAVRVANWEIDTRRAGWAGPETTGRLDHVDRESAVAVLGEVHERVRRATPGEVDGWEGRWRQFAGVARGTEHAGRIRIVAYSDAEGERRGVLVYRVTEDDSDFARNTLEVRVLLAETREAYAALWRFVVEHDLVHRVRARLRSVDEPLPWLVRDERGLEATVRDHGWVRILDVPTALQARSFSAPVDVVIAVEDPLGFADGVWRLSVGDSGSATLTPTDESPQATLSVRALGAAYLGGVRLSTLRWAGMVGGSPEAVDALDRAFASPVAPSLGIWY